MLLEGTVLLESKTGTSVALNTGHGNGQLEPVASEPVTPSEQQPNLVPAQPPIKAGVVVGAADTPVVAVDTVSILSPLHVSLKSLKQAYPRGHSLCVPSGQRRAQSRVYSLDPQKKGGKAAGGVVGQLEPVASEPVTPSEQQPNLVPAHPPIKAGVVVGLAVGAETALVVTATVALPVEVVKTPAVVPTAVVPIKAGVVVGRLAVGADAALVSATVVFAMEVVKRPAVVPTAVVLALVVVATVVIAAQLVELILEAVTPSGQHPNLVPAHPPSMGGKVVGAVTFVAGAVTFVAGAVLLVQGSGTKVALALTHSGRSKVSASVPFMDVMVPFTKTE